MEEQIPPSEDVLWTGTVSHWHYAGRWFFILLLLAGLAATFLLPMPMAMTEGSRLWIARGLVGILLFMFLVWMWVDRSRRRYTITNKRVSTEFGIFSKSSKEMRVEDIRSINLSTTGFSGLLGIGRVEFSSSSMPEDDVVFWNVPSAEAIRDRVRTLQAKS